MLQRHGLLSQWQPLCRKYSVSSGNSMPQKWQVRISLRLISRSPSWPVDVMVPLQMGVELAPLVALGVAGVGGPPPPPPPLPPFTPGDPRPDPLLRLLDSTELLLLLSSSVAFRVIRLLAFAQMRRLRSSRRSDFSGETWSKIRWINMVAIYCIILINPPWSVRWFCCCCCCCCYCWKPVLYRCLDHYRSSGPSCPYPPTWAPFGQ